MKRAKKQALFLDRDGVINELIMNNSTGEYESPHSVEDFFFCKGAIEALINISAQNKFLIFLISNQPSYAKGKTSLQNILDIQSLFDKQMKLSGIVFSDYYYCYHHPDGVEPEYTKKCLCRKPNPYFIQKANQKFDLDLEHSWFIGDQDSDIFCGQKENIRTILVENPHSQSKREKAKPDFRAKSLLHAITILLEQISKKITHDDKKRYY